MKSILIISQNFYPEIGSAANRIKNMAELFSKENKVSVLTVKPCYPNSVMYKKHSYKTNQYEVFQVTTFFKRYSSNLFFRLLFYLDVFIRLIIKAIILSKDKDIIIVTSPPIFVGLVGIFLKYIHRKKVVLDLRDLWPKTLEGIGRLNYKVILRIAYFFEKKMYCSLDYILINSMGFYDYLISKGVDTNKISYVPNSLTINELIDSRNNLELNIKNDEILIVYIGNIGLAQDLTKFLELAIRYRFYSNIQFKVIGHGLRKQELLNFIKRNHMKNVSVLKPCSRKEANSVLKQSTISFIGLNHNPVFEDVLPGKLIDSLGNGIPILADTSGISAEIVSKAKAGLVIREIDVLMDPIIDSFIFDAHKRRLYSLNAYNYAKKFFNWQINFEILKKGIKANNE
ncbi:glycosyltransferase family 4 protein [Enterococcus avium]|uniref:glycosyltransferase family 4 protein n=1 Tax=Enterococcus avium TaxID=33945 RepID=UPI001F57652B|nr:glycosyltransferase family 4 protein [Enterococcus avium]